MDTNQGRWRLIRIFKDKSKKSRKQNIFTLKTGLNQIGRNPVADVITESVFASRKHCTISLDSENKLTLDDTSSNGTFVNSELVKLASKILEKGDIIGIGCDLATVDEKIKCFAYKLIDMESADEVIDLVDDDNDDDNNADGSDSSISIENKNKPELEVINIDVEQPIEKTMTDNNENSTSLANNNEDEETFYSQQYLFEIKQEVATGTDDSIVDLCDDEDYNDSENDKNWAMRLSQDQDKLEKIKVKLKNIPKKASKMIDSLPEIKMTRRKNDMVIASSSTSMIQKNNDIPKEMVAKLRKRRLSEIATVQIDEPPQISTNKVATKPKVKVNEPRGTFLQQPIEIKKRRLSKAEADRERIESRRVSVGDETIFKAPPTSDTNESQQPKHQKSFEKELIEVKDFLVSKKKKRIAHVKKYESSHRRFSTNVRKEHRSTAKSVHFKPESELIDVKYFEKDPAEDVEFIINTAPRVAPANYCDNPDFQADPLHRIISDVTLWNPNWLKLRDKLPPIVGEDIVLSPLLTKYSSYEVFQNTITPLLRYELWASIMADYENNVKQRIKIEFTEVNLVQRGDRKRFVYHCRATLDNNNQRINVGDFVVVELSIGKFFAYVTSAKVKCDLIFRRIYFIMEASPNDISKLITRDARNCSMITISNIRTELKLFSAVFSLKKSPIKDYILDPLKHQCIEKISKSPNFHYIGFDKMNDLQLNVLESIYSMCLKRTPNVSLIEGPPGTGKSRLIVNLILQLIYGVDLKQKLRILLCASSNAAVDIIACKLLKIRSKMTSSEKKARLNMIRFGVMDSMHPDARSIALHYLVRRTMNASQAYSAELNSFLDEKNLLQLKLSATSANVQNANNISADNYNNLKKRITMIEEKISKKLSQENKLSYADEFKISASIMKNANLVFTTLSSSINLKQYVKSFDICIIDEASQCIEPWSMIPLQFDIFSLILVGDAQQLPAIVLSSAGRENQLERSLFTRLKEVCADTGNKSGMFSLREQYRMHPEICHWPNSYFYENNLISASTNVDVNFKLTPYAVFSLDCLQTNIGNIHYYNKEEARFVIELLKILVKYADPKSFSYGIITPYSKQRSEIQTHINQSKELSSFQFPVNTIDSYQGQEKDIIIMSNVRTTGIGFLANPQRLNVALTRAKKCLLICGNFTSVKNIRVWRSLLNDAEKRKRLHKIPKKYSEKYLNTILTSK